MIWLAMTLAVGGLLAQRFRILVLAPATFVMVVMAIAVGVSQTSSPWSIISMIATASVGIQIGYFLGMLIQRGGASLLSRWSARSSRSGPQHVDLPDSDFVSVHLGSSQAAVPSGPHCARDDVSRQD